MTLQPSKVAPPAHGIEVILRGIDKVCEWVGKGVSYLILGLALVVGYDVLMRFLLDSPTVWAQEFSTMLFGTFIILGGAYTGLKRGHVSMDILYNRFSRRNRAVIDIITFLVLGLPFLGVLIWLGSSSAWRSLRLLEHDSTQWGPPLYPFRIMLPLGALLFFLQSVAKFIRDIMVVIGLRKEVD